MVFQCSSLSQIIFNVIYVVPFYLSRTTRPSPTLTRDAPSVIRARLRAVTTSCIVASAITVYVVHEYGTNDFGSVFRILGWYPISLFDVGRILLLVAILFVGPLFEIGIVEGGWRSWITGRELLDVLSSWTGFRNLVAVSLPAWARVAPHC